jgi:uncharacterized protein YegL
MKILPVYLIFDCSNSMRGEPMSTVKQGIRTLIEELRSVPKAQENIRVSIIAFSDGAEQLVPLTDLANFREPTLKARGATALGKALRLLQECMDREVAKTSGAKDTYLEPLVFLMIEGQPTGSWVEEANKLRESGRANIVVIALGPDSDETSLKHITAAVVKSDNLDASVFVNIARSLLMLIPALRDESYLYTGFQVGRSTKGVFEIRFPVPQPCLLYKPRDREPGERVFDSVDNGGWAHISRAKCGKDKTPLVPADTVDRVHFSITSPPVLKAGASHAIDVWAHLAREREKVIRIAREEAAGADLRIRTKGPVKVARGTTMTVRLCMGDLAIEPPEDTILWEGEIGNATFVVTVPKTAALGTRSGSASIYVAGIAVAKLYFVVQVGEESVASKLLEIGQKRYRRIFPSYADEDRNEVLARIHGMQKVAPSLDVFYPAAQLRSGEHWQERLEKEILSRDIMCLFWSKAASQSSWVDWEWRTGLRERGIDFIDPCPLVPPDEVPPPKELADQLHFNDWILAYMRGTRQVDK